MISSQWRRQPATIEGDLAPQSCSNSTLILSLSKGAVGGGLGRLGPVDRLHVPGHLAPVLVGAQGQAVAHEMDDASLDLGLGEDRVDRLREAFQAVNHRDQAVLDAPGPELVHHPQPELGPFALLDPQPQDLLGAVQADADRQVDRLVPDRPLFRTGPSSRILTRKASKKITG